MLEIHRKSRSFVHRVRAWQKIWRCDITKAAAISNFSFLRLLQFGLGVSQDVVHSVYGIISYYLEAAKAMFGFMFNKSAVALASYRLFRRPLSPIASRA
jgi:hypothetical protein